MSENPLIRFIDTKYSPLLYLPDGESIILTNIDGIKSVRQCTYLDDCHFLVGGRTYHVYEFASVMERAGTTFVPAKPLPLPDHCYSVLPDTGELVFIEKGKPGVAKASFSENSAMVNRKFAMGYNRSHRVTMQQEAAMLGGALRGWRTPLARTSSYDLYGNQLQPAKRKAPMAKSQER